MVGNGREVNAPIILYLHAIYEKKIVHLAVMRSRYDLRQGSGAENIFSLPVGMRRPFSPW